MATVTDLGERVKKKFPGVYDSMDSAELGRKVQKKYPKAYTQFTELKGSGGGGGGTKPPTESQQYYTLLNDLSSRIVTDREPGEGQITREQAIEEMVNRFRDSKSRQTIANAIYGSYPDDFTGNQSQPDGQGGEFIGPPSPQPFIGPPSPEQQPAQQPVQQQNNQPSATPYILPAVGQTLGNVANFFSKNTQALAKGTGRLVGEAVAYGTDPNVRQQATASSVTDLDMQLVQKYRELPPGPQKDRLAAYIKNNIVNRIGINFEDILPEQGTTSVRKIAGQTLGTMAEVAPFAKAKAVVGAARTGLQLTGRQLALQGAKSGAAYGAAYGTAEGLQGEGGVGDIAKRATIGGAIGAGAGAILSPILGKLGQKFGEMSRKKEALTNAKFIAKSGLTKFKTSQALREGIALTVGDTRRTQQQAATDGTKYVMDVYQRAGDIASKLETYKPGLAEKLLNAVKPTDTIDDISNKALALIPDEKVGGIVSAVIPEERAGGIVADKADDLVTTNTINQEDQSVVGKLLEAIRGSAKVSRTKQDAILSQERSRRLAQYMGRLKGAKSQSEVRKALGALGGEMKKADFSPLSLKQKDLDGIFRMVAKSDKITGFEKATATTGLEKIFGRAGGQIPTAGEIKVLEKVYGTELTAELLAKRTVLQKIGEGVYQTLNIPRAVMASTDLSAPFRQGVFMVGRPKQFFPNLLRQFKYAFNKKSYDSAMQEIASRPTYAKMTGRVAFTDIGSDIAGREEAFASSWAEKIPGLGKIIRGSNRAYTGFLNKLRADVFDDVLKKAAQKGLDTSDDGFLNSLAAFVNNGTGRGSIQKLEPFMKPLNSVLFSPRLAISRIQTFNPMYYARLDPFVRKEALKTLFIDASLAGTILTLAKNAGAEVETDPTSADFAKIKVGNTRYDILGGHQQYIRYAAQLIRGEVKSSTTGAKMTLGEDDQSLTRADIASRFFESKTAPVASFALGLFRGTNVLGQEFNLPEEVKNRFIPLVIQDTVDTIKEHGSEIGIPMSVPAFFGAGTQTYGPGTDLSNIPEQARAGKEDSIRDILVDAKYFVSSPSDVLTRSSEGTEKKVKLSGDEEERFRIEMGEATVRGLLDAPKTPGWAEASQDKKRWLVKNAVSRERTKVRDQWKDAKGL